MDTFTRCNLEIYFEVLIELLCSKYSRVKLITTIKSEIHSCTLSQ